MNVPFKGLLVAASMTFGVQGVKAQGAMLHVLDTANVVMSSTQGEGAIRAKLLDTLTGGDHPSISHARVSQEVLPILDSLAKWNLKRTIVPSENPNDITLQGVLSSVEFGDQGYSLTISPDREDAYIVHITIADFFGYSYTVPYFLGIQEVTGLDMLARGLLGADLSKFINDLIANTRGYLSIQQSLISSQ